MLETAKVIIQNNNVKRKGYIHSALQDTGSQLTCITEKLLRVLALQSIKKESLWINVFGKGAEEMRELNRAEI